MAVKKVDTKTAVKKVDTKTAVKKVGPWQIGQKYLVRTVTFFTLGLLEEVHDHELVFSNASWVADTGRWSVAIKDGTLSEVEVVQDPVIVGRMAIVDAAIWTHALPTESK